MDYIEPTRINSKKLTGRMNLQRDLKSTGTRKIQMDLEGLVKGWKDSLVQIMMI